MMSEDYERFIGVIQNLASVFGKKLDDGQIKTYWNALKDRPLADIENRSEKYCQRGKFFPKPRDLRPNDQSAEAPSEESQESKRRFEQLNRESEVSWNKRLAEDEWGTKLALCDALEARYSVQPDQGSLILAEKREWLKERRAQILWKISGGKRVA